MAEPETNEERLAALMRSAQGGDAEAYAALMQEVAVRVRQIVRYRRAFLERADVEDLVQDVLLSVHAVRATYDAARPFIPWLLAITRNRLADAARRYARHGAHEVTVDDLDVTFFSEDTNTLTATYGDPGRAPGGDCRVAGRSAERDRDAETARAVAQGSRGGKRNERGRVEGRDASRDGRAAPEA